MKERIRKCAIVLFWLTVWAAAALAADNEILLAGPGATFRELWEMLGGGSFYRAVGGSLLRIGTGFLAGSLWGVALAAGSLEGTAERLCNVFEEVLPPEVEREVREIKAEMLRRGALNAAMSGSGPAVFGIFREKEAAAAAVAALKTRYVQTFLTSPVERLDGPVV